MRFIYSILTDGEDPKDVLAEGEMDEDNLDEVWNEMTDSSDDDQDWHFNEHGDLIIPNSVQFETVKSET